MAQEMTRQMRPAGPRPVVVVFNRRHGRYVAGDRAGFPEAQAMDLVGLGVASRVGAAGYLDKASGAVRRTLTRAKTPTVGEGDEE